MAGPKTMPKKADIVSQVAERIRNSDNVLVALSKDPSVDELSAALGLTFMLDKIGKHATAIFSGRIPNAIEFLEPEKTFEANTDSLQDFIIALDKEKADHLRYKIEGDYVKVFITPYKTTINESDMEFSHGDYNVDLVISLNVSTPNDLDRALSEYGRIMHDATSINISTNIQGKFGDLEWGDAKYSSVSEMVFELSDVIKENESIVNESVATALLAGIVAATNRFSNERTTPNTMSAAAKLMSAGADQQLISSSIPVEILTSNVVDANADFAAEDDGQVGEPTKTAADSVLSVSQHEAKTSESAPEFAELTGESKAKPEAEPKNSASVGAGVAPANVDTASAEAKPVLAEPPKVAPAPEPVDSTQLEVHHGAIDFDPNEDLPPEERAKIKAEKERIAAEKAAEAARIREQHAPIDAVIAEINAKNGITDPFALPESAPEPAPKPVSKPISKPISEPSLKPAPINSYISDVKDEHGDGDGVSDPSAHIGLDASEKKKIMPLGEVMSRDDTPKDYAAMMGAELASPDLPPNPGMPSAPVVNQFPEPNYANPMPPITAPVAPNMPPLSSPAAAEYVDPATVASNPILPPPPAPFAGNMNQYMPPANMPSIPMPSMPPMAPASPVTPLSVPPASMSTNGPSASEIASSIQSNNPVVQNTPNMDAGEGGYPPAGAPVMPGVAVSVGAPTLEAVPSPIPNPAATPAPNPAPAPAIEDAGAFHIPGM